MSGARKFETPEDEALEIAINTRSKILDGRYNPVAVVRSCYTVAEYLQRNDDLSWLFNELNGYTVTKNKKAIVPNYRIVNFIFHTGLQPYPHSVMESIQELDGLIKRNISNSYRVNYTTFRMTPSRCESIVGAIVTRCMLFLNNVITELQYGGIIENLMEEIRRQTDEKLTLLGDIMIAETQSLHSSLTSNNPAEWSKVGHSCRRMLEILADHVFPAKGQPFVGKDGKCHPINEQNYLNRLIAFLDEKTRGDERNLVEGEVKLLASHLKGLNEEVCSVEHKKNLEKYRVNLVAVRTYIVVSELLRLAETK
jgi:hypothetical protein